MAQVEDFWNIKKIGQSYRYKKVYDFVSEGKCYTNESITFKYNGLKYSVDFILSFEYNESKSTFGPANPDGYDELSKFTMHNIVLTSIDIKYNTSYNSHAINTADLTNMNDPVSKAIRASKYAIENFFKL